MPAVCRPALLLGGGSKNAKGRAAMPAAAAPRGGRSKGSSAGLAAEESAACGKGLLQLMVLLLKATGELRGRGGGGGAKGGTKDAAPALEVEGVAAGMGASAGVGGAAALAKKPSMLAAGSWARTCMHASPPVLRLHVPVTPAARENGGDGGGGCRWGQVSAAEVP
eukprot:1156820-Pelagomonas_calceolata.AAC.5